MKHNAPQRQTITIGDLCQAIAEGQIPATLHNGEWHLSARAIRRLASLQRQARASASKDCSPLPTH